MRLAALWRTTLDLLVGALLADAAGGFFGTTDGSAQRHGAAGCQPHQHRLQRGGGRRLAGQWTGRCPVRDNATGDVGFYAGFTGGGDLLNGGTTWHDVGPTTTAYRVVG
jgi:hypothetical protein